jgi:transcriptional regulator GlxA family with amidase domain
MSGAESIGTFSPQKVVGILLFDEVEILDYCGPFEVFSATRLNMENRNKEPSPFQVVLISQLGTTIIVTRGGMKVVPDFSFVDCPKLDILLVPGGMGTRIEMNNAVVLEFIREKAKEVELLTSVCTGSMLLASAGLLDGLEATTHWRSFDEMKAFPLVKTITDQHVVQAKGGTILTSAGISAGIDLALQVVAKCFTETVARETAKQMEYPYPESNERRVDIHNN